jgi:hypothetical protein
VEQERDQPLGVVVAEMRADVRHLAGDVGDLRVEVRADIRRLDDRIFQLLLVQVATLVTALASLATALATAITA